jgi:hypothetical protein
MEYQPAHVLRRHLVHSLNAPPAIREVPIQGTRDDRSSTNFVDKSKSPTIIPFAIPVQGTE